MGTNKKNSFKTVYLITAKVILLFFFTCFIIGCKQNQADFLESNRFKIESVISGNQILLDNGFKIYLTGITPVNSTFEALNQFKDKEIRLEIDNRTRQEIDMYNKPVYAYVSLTSSGECINTTLLEKGFAYLDLNNLNDSLSSYYNYFIKSPLNKETLTKEVIDKKRNYPRKIIYVDDELIAHVKDLIEQSSEISEKENKQYQVVYLWTYLYTHWNYKTDTSNLALIWHTSIESIRACKNNDGIYSGNCDDFAILYSSIVLSLGFTPRFIAAHINGKGKAYCEIFIPDNQWTDFEQIVKKYQHTMEPLQFKAGSQNGETGKWVNADFWAASLGGRYYEGTRFLALYKL